MSKTKRNKSSGRPTLVIAVGASAGGLKALKEFFSSRRPIENAVFLVSQHLDDKGKSLAVEALKRITKLQVLPLTAGKTLVPDTVYSVPPHTLVSFSKGKTVLTAARTTAKKLAVIDTLFSSIGKEFGQNSVGVVLSGNASDGSQGLRDLNDAGGLTLAQTPSSAEHRSMPEHAISTGIVDQVLEPKRLWDEIADYADYIAPNSTDAQKAGLRDEITAAITSICEILFQKTRHDFKHYKTSTLSRRIERRMHVLQFSSVQAYLDHLKANNDESETLFKELLINVTSFFRDKDAFEALSNEVLKKLVRDRQKNKKIRIWVAGCSTGEEAYSLAILMHELFEHLKVAPEVQIIATDIDDAALNVARRGAYPVAIADHVSPERLSRYFIKKAGKFHVTKEIREMCLFSIHNLITDPPFSQIDLITCRNVMIYLGSHLQQKLFPVFHYSLRPNGYLFLGTSETLAPHRELFKGVNTKHRIAQRRDTAIKLPSIGASVQNYLSHFQENEKITNAELGLICQRIALDEMPLKYAAVNEEGQIITSSSGLSKYAQIPEGTFQNNIVKLVAPSLRSALRAAFNTAKKEKRKITNEDCTIRSETSIERTQIIVQPMPQLGDMSELYWVAFQSLGSVQTKELRKEPSIEVDADLIDQLERELTLMRSELDKSVQDLEATNEELKSSNEELLSMNEELQSANEELETSKEEVQSSNEALQRANSDLENLLASTEIATLFLDDAYAIRGFTPAIQDIYNIRPADIGRELTDFTSRARHMPDYPVATSVQEHLADENELVLPDGRVFLRRVLPYKTSEGVRDGLVVSFIDITELRQSEGRFLKLANSVPVITWTSNAEGDVDFFNSRWYEYTGQQRKSATGWGWGAALHPEDLERTLRVWKKAVATGEDYKIEYRLKNHKGEYRWFRGSGVAFKDERSKIVNWFGTCVDINEEKEQVDLLEKSGQRLKTIVEAIPQYIWRANPDGSADFVTERFCEFVGYAPDELLGWGWTDLIHEDDKQHVIDAWQDSRDRGESVSVDFKIKLGSTKDYRWVRSEGNPFFDSTNTLVKYYGTWTDIHERVLAENARLESDARFKTMANSAPVLVWIADAAQKRTWFNKAWLDHTGADMKASLGSLWIDFLHPDDKDLYLSTYRNHYAKQTPFEVEYRLRHKDGTYRWISARGVPLFSADGKFDGFIGACLDIHETKALAEAVKSSEAHFRTLVDRSPAIMWITNKKAECTYLSQQWYEVTGRTPEEDLGFGWVENCHPDDRKAAGEAFFSAVEARGRINIRYRLRHKDGKYRWAIDSGLPLTSDDGEFLGYIGTVIDIHDQVVSEIEYAGLRDRFNRSVAATELGVWYCDLPFDELIWNREVKKHFFMPPDARVTIDSFYAHIHPEDRGRTKAAIQYSIEHHASYDILYRTIDPKDDSKLNWIRAIGWTDYDKDGNPVRFDGITLDVTTEHYRQEELRRAKVEAEAAKISAETANESKTRFLANMSHEIRTPLSAIVGYSDLLRSRLSEDTEANAYIERISRNSSGLSRLIDELLDLSKIEADRLEVEYSAIDIDAVIEDVRSAMILKAEEKGIELRFNWISAKPKRVITDPIRLSQILINIVGNAVKFTEKGSVQVDLSANQSTFVARITDTGIGLTPEQQLRVFQPFMQADASVTRKYGGTGLGLVLSKKLSQLLGGDLRLEKSAAAKGSVFVVEVSILSENEERIVEAEKENSKELGPESLKGKKVLVVDDSPDNRIIVSLFLKGIGATIVEASNGEEGYKRALIENIDIVLMDIQMPVMDGYQAMKNLNAHGYGKPVLALTAHAFKEEKERCLAAGFTGYVTKPVNRMALLKSVCDLVLK